MFVRAWCRRMGSTDAAGWTQANMSSLWPCTGPHASTASPSSQSAECSTYNDQTDARGRQKITYLKILSGKINLQPWLCHSAGIILPPCFTEKKRDFFCKILWDQWITLEFGGCRLNVIWRASRENGPLRIRAMIEANTGLVDILVDNSVIIPSFQNRTSTLSDLKKMVY